MNFVMWLWVNIFLTQKFHTAHVINVAPAFNDSTHRVQCWSNFQLHSIFEWDLISWPKAKIYFVIQFDIQFQTVFNWIWWQSSETVARKCSVKYVLKNFTKFTGKHLYERLFLNIVAGPRPATLFKKKTGTGVSLWIFGMFKKTFSQKAGGFTLFALFLFYKIYTNFIAECIETVYLSFQKPLQYCLTLYFLVDFFSF